MTLVHVNTLCNTVSEVKFRLLCLHNQGGKVWKVTSATERKQHLAGQLARVLK